MTDVEIVCANEGKKRSQSDKIGRLKYNQALLKKILLRIQGIELMQRTIVKGLEGMFQFDKPYIQKFACVDDVDREILDLLYQNQPDGLYPKIVAKELCYFHLDRYKVTRRLRAMNRRLEREIGQDVAEKRGHHWALTGFAIKSWGEVSSDCFDSSKQPYKINCEGGENKTWRK